MIDFYDFHEYLSVLNIRELNDCCNQDKLVRLELYIRDIPSFKKLTLKLNLNFSLSIQSFRISIDKGMDFWASSLQECTDSEPNAMRMVYVHPKKENCDKAKLLDERNDDLNLGIELNYPQCCIDAYCKWQTDNEDIDPITTITNLYPFNGEIQFYDFPNPFSRYFGSGLYSHFPCSLTCKETRRIAKQSLNSLQTHFPFIADKLVQHENSFVIFQKEGGVCIWRNFEVSDSRIQLDKESFQGQGRLKQIFEAVDEIELHENELKLFSQFHNQEIFRTNNCFIEAFDYKANANQQL